MILAYKYLLLQDGLLCVFPQMEPEPRAVVSIGIYADDLYVLVGEHHAARLTASLLDTLQRTRTLYLAVSAVHDEEIVIQMSVHFDELVMGKLLAYQEWLCEQARE